MKPIKNTLKSSLNFLIYCAGVVSLLLAAVFAAFYVQAKPWIEKEHEQSRQNSEDGISSEQACINYLDKLAHTRSQGEK